MKLRPALSTLHQCHSILRVASWIVPSELRRQWLQEWEAEVWHHWNRISQEGSLNAKHRSQLRLHCWGAFRDAAWFRLNRKDLERNVRDLSRSASACLVVSSGIFVLVAISSGLLPRTRAILFPESHSIGDRVVTVSRTARVESSEWPVPYSWVKVWRRDARVFDEIASYSWETRQEILKIKDRSSTVSSVQVEDSFFSVFAVQAKLGSTFLPKNDQGCSNCVVLSYSTWQRWFGSDPRIEGQKMRLNDREAVVLGVLPEGFWFPSRAVGIWRVSNEGLVGPKAQVGVAARLRQGVGEPEAESLLERLATENSSDSLPGFDVQIWGIQKRVREPLASYMISLTIVLLVASVFFWSGGKHEGPAPTEGVVAWRWWAFLAAKTSILLLSCLVAVVEFAPAPYAIRTNKVIFTLESASLWIFTLGCMGILWWSFNDQQSRCRRCMERLVFPTRIGDPGCLLLSWAGTELLCEKGHGILHVTETDCCWLEHRRWTQLDDSWKGLFVGSKPYNATEDAA
jgi:MacB-like periplasmic core domain